jgi:hypothetical protein
VKLLFWVSHMNEIQKANSYKYFQSEIYYSATLIPFLSLYLLFLHACEQ